jgi:hypothetical protein
MSKPKTEAQKRKDKMGRVHNKIVAILDKSELDFAEIYLILDNMKQSVMESFRKATGQK